MEQEKNNFEAIGARLGENQEISYQLSDRGQKTEELANKIKNSDKEARLGARNELIENMQGLLFDFAIKFFELHKHKDYCRECGFDSVENLVSELNSHLIEHFDQWIESWEPLKGSFSQRVCTRLKWQLYDVGKKIVGPSARTARDHSKEGKPPIELEYLDAPRTVDPARGGPRIQIDDWNNLVSKDLLPEEHLLVKERAEQIIALVNGYIRKINLTDKGRKVLEDLCKGDLNFRQIGDKDGVTESRVSQIKAEFIKFLKEHGGEELSLDDIRDAYEILEMYKEDK